MDPIKYIFEKLALTGKIARSQVALLEYDIVHITQKAIKGSTLADHLAYNPLLDYQPMKHDFPNEDILMLMGEPKQEKGWAMYFDGASNSLGHEEEADRKPWYYDIKQYLKNKEYSLGAIENNKKTLRRMAMGFLLNRDVLYKRSPNTTLLRCVDAKEAEEILEEVHEGTFGTHASGPIMA
ncbi:hypothetical protein CR513_09257, partial [Mucuna pruriens]